MLQTDQQETLKNDHSALLADEELISDPALNTLMDMIRETEGKTINHTLSFISNVEPNSIAARDGRIKEGDRILQINGFEVQDREKAVALLSSEEAKSIRLLVTRPEIQEAVWLDDEQQRLVEELKMEILEEKRKQREQSFEMADKLQGDEDVTTDTATCSSNNQDSGFGRSTDSTEHQPLLARLYRRKCSLTGQGGGDGDKQELKMLNEELRSIELECQSIMQAHQLRKSQQLEQSQSAPCSPGTNQKTGQKRHGRLADIHEYPERSDSDRVREKDSSSAYNTAESARSTPLGMERSPDHSLQRQISITNQKNLRLASSASSNPIPIPKPQGTHRPCRPADQGPSYMQLLQQHSSLEYSQSQLSLLSVCRDPMHRNGRAGEPRLEWKVKVRADGTRYVARRPARDRILRERALRIREERSGGMTTDDDAMSEMKMGRYWSKEERKQHLARAREQRKRREFMQKSRLDCLKEGPASGAEGKKEINILELSHKKMMKKRNKKILDNWMTIQELMSHGARVPEGSTVHNAFLSVTTV
uniref:PDZ domain containing ring finger 4 n=1 Tax=Poecilia latipinna TaxID=48699 RepID=A0A3B3TRX2_9TELE